ncbi:hypothetical protein [Arthrobacter sp. KNU40]|uniref:hypothetical protein n=1 Tax=Arthrobacter sp. KNU40 TaxID=3447965 RepID=UPI003F5F5002
MIRQPLLASELQSPVHLSVRPKPGPQKRQPTIQLGNPGRCPSGLTLVIIITEESGSLGGPAGNDPISNRYNEARHAVTVLARHCRCGRCLAAVIHFDTPTSRCIDPTPLTRTGKLRILSGLAVPPDAAGSSYLGPGLAAAEAIAARHPDHEVVLIILTDWELFDTNLPELLARLTTFKGSLFAVGLRNSPPESLAGPMITSLTIRPESPPGSLARAVFAGLTAHRQGKQPAATDPP